MSVARTFNDIDVVTTGHSSQTFEITVPAGTDLLLVSHQSHGDENPSSITWNAEALTLISKQAADTNGTVGLRIYGLVNPTPGTANVVITLAASAPHSFSTALGYSGVVTDSVAAATNVISTDENSNGTTTVLTSGGASGNALVLYAGSHDHTSSPATNDGGFSEIYDTITGDVSNEGAGYVAELLTGLPGGATVTWSADQANTGVIVELVAAGDTTAPTLSDPTADSVGATSFTPKCTTDEDNGTMYMVVVPNADAPTAAQVKAGTNSSGTAALATDSDAISVTGEHTFAAVTGLTASTSYEVAYAHEDAAGNLSAVSTTGLTTLAAGGPDITTAPTLTSATATVYTVNLGEVDANATAYLGIYAPGATPTDAEIKAGTGASGVQSQAVTADTPFGTVTLTATEVPPWPYASIKIVYEGGSAFSAITTLAKSYLDAPTGKQYKELAGVSFADWLDDAVPAPVAGDVLIWDAKTDPDAYDFVLLSDGNYSYDSGGDTSRQTGTRELWRFTDQSFSGEQEFAVNNEPPVVPEEGVEVTRYENIAFAAVDLVALATDPESDDLTGDQSPDDVEVPPPGTTYTGDGFTTTEASVVAGVYGNTYRITDEYGDWSEFGVQFTDLATGTMPDVDDGDVAEAAAIASITGAGLTSPTVSYQSSETVSEGNVISQTPAAGTVHPVADSTSIVVSVINSFGGPAANFYMRFFLRWRIWR